MNTEKTINPYEETRFKITYDASVAGILNEITSTLAISTYQAGKVIFIGANEASRLYQIPISFKKPMGIALMDNKMAIATLDEIQIYSASEALAEMFPNNPGVYDRLYVPRATYYCGETDLHDLGFGDGGLWAANTRFSCLATFDINFSFTPRWKPPFVTDLKPEDRCHLNGMAMIDKVPTYVTALSSTDTREGWRENITGTGILMKVPEGEIILENLPMPHSPRVIDGKLYLLLSATGELIRVDVEKKSFEVVTKINGFIRGMAGYKNYLFLGLSKVRKTSKTFSKLPVSEMADHAGIIIYDLEKNQKVGVIRYESTVEEIYDVQIIPDTVKPGLITTADPLHKSAITTKNTAFWKKIKD